MHTSEHKHDRNSFTARALLNWIGHVDIFLTQVLTSLQYLKIWSVNADQKWSIKKYFCNHCPIWAKAKKEKKNAIKAITAGTCEPVHQRATFLFALNVQLYYLSFASTSFIFVLLEMRSNLVSNFQGTNQPLMWSFSPCISKLSDLKCLWGFFCLSLHYL